MQVIKYPKREDWNQILSRPENSVEEMAELVNQVFEQVKKEGDNALLKYTSLYDGAEIDSVEVSIEEIEASERLVSQELKNALTVAANNIEKYHSTQLIKSEVIETSVGVSCWRKATPINKVGLYVPGGTAPLFSTVLMLGIPAKLAGCQEVVLCTPPNKKGEIDPAILYACKLVGVDRVFRIGGIQAIAAMAFGTETMPNVYKIFGPGNQYVTAAKQEVTKKGVAIDMPAGPSEVLVIADETADDEFVASDLLSQAEHGADSQVVLLTWNEALMFKLQAAPSVKDLKK